MGGKVKTRLERQEQASGQDLLDRVAPVGATAGTLEPPCLIFWVLSLSSSARKGDVAWAYLLAGPDLSVSDFIQW